MEIKRLTVLAESDTDKDQLGDKGSPTRLEGEGSCEGFSQVELDNVLGKHSAVLSSDPGLTSLAELVIDTGDCDPISQFPYRLPDRLLPKIKEEIEALQANDIIEPSDSLWASPVVPVSKANGDIRICVDYRKVNSYTKPFSFYMPTVDKIVDKVDQSSDISKIDLTKCFHQIPVAVNDRDKTTFVCPFGRFRYNACHLGCAMVQLSSNS